MSVPDLPCSDLVDRCRQFFANRLSVHEAHGVAEYMTETEDEFEARMMTKPATILFWYMSWSTMFNYMMGNFEKGIANAEIAVANQYGLRGHFNIPVTYTFQALCQLQLAMRLGDSVDDVAKRDELVALTGAPLPHTYRRLSHPASCMAVTGRLRHVSPGV